MGVAVACMLDRGDQLPAFRAESIEALLERRPGDIRNVEVDAPVLPLHEATRCKRRAREEALRGANERAFPTAVRDRGWADPKTRPLPLRNRARNLPAPDAPRLRLQGTPAGPRKKALKTA